MRAWLWVAVATAGCSDGYDVRVRLTPSQLSWTVYTSSCDTADIPSPGSCDFTGDKGQPPPCEIATCATRAELDLRGQLVRHFDGDTDIGDVENPAVADELVITGCGRDMRIPLPTTLPLAPTITSFVGTHVEFFATPQIDRITIDYGTTFNWNYCAVSKSTTSYDFLTDVPHENWAIVGAWAPLTTTTTPLGEAHVRAGSTTEGMAN